jgi:hypothetical protein
MFQVAILFLITNKFPHEATWRAFFEAAAQLPAPANLHLLKPAAEASGGQGEEAAEAAAEAATGAGGGAVTATEAASYGLNGKDYVHPLQGATYSRALGYKSLHPFLTPWEEEQYPYWIVRHNATVAEAEKLAEKEAKEEEENVGRARLLQAAEAGLEGQVVAFDGARINTAGVAAAGWDAKQSGVPAWEAALIKAEQGRLVAAGRGELDPHAMMQRGSKLQETVTGLPSAELQQHGTQQVQSPSGDDNAMDSHKQGSRRRAHLRDGPEDPTYSAQGLFNVYIHTSLNYTVPKHSIFAGRQLKELQDTTHAYCQHALADAMLLLLKAALAEPDNVKFVMISDTSVPLYRPEVIYAQVLAEELSRVDACGGEGKDLHDYR